MQMQTVASSQIDSVGFENGTLAVKFKSGGTYTYAGVSADTFNAMLKAKSIGSFLATNVKGKYNYKKVA